MKNTVLRLLVLATFGMINCHQSTEVDPIKEHTQHARQANMWLRGRWKLVKVSAMIPNPPVPNVELVVDENLINLIQDGIQTDRVNYEIIETDYGLKLNTTAQPRKDNWYVRNSTLYINTKRMFLDLGMAMDGPGYEFDKVN